MELSKRLEALVHLAEPGNVVADIGCDHGYVVIWLLKNKIFQRGIAMDVRRGPLEAAEKNVSRYMLKDSIEIRLSDGMQQLKAGEADCVICAGMGGALMRRILQQDEEKLMLGSIKQLILQPQSEIFLVRSYLREIGYVIHREDMIFEDGKYYPMFRAIRLNETESSEKRAETEEIEDYYGPLLLKYHHPVLKEYIEKEERIAEDIRKKLLKANSQGEKRKADLQELENKLKRIATAKEFFREA